ncbi:MAG: hypothetical protein AB7H86_20205 [Blastocatellales bacterium]
MSTKRFIFAILIVSGITALFACTMIASVPQQSVITIDPATTYQMINGWEATSQAGQDELKAVFPFYQSDLYDKAVNDLGINRLRLEIRSGAENPVDYFQRWQSGQISEEQYKPRRYEIINDNNDPNILDPNGIHFTEMDSAIDKVVVPIRQLVAARGEKLYVNLNYVDFGQSAFEHRDNPEEYAEFMQAVFQHIKGKYGWVPDGIEIVLENDNARWNGTQIGQVIVATGNRLRAAGFNPEFIGPSSTDIRNAITSFDEMVKVPGISDYLSEFSYHRYGGVNDDNIKAIGFRTIQNNVTSAHLELIGATYFDLFSDLSLGRNSSWAQFTIAWVSSQSGDDGAHYFIVNDSNPSTPVVVYGQRTKFLRQVFKFVRKGAIRIGATADNNSYQPLAFINADCSQVVAVKADTAGSFTINGLPAGTYGIKYSTGAEFDVNLPDTTITAGQPLTTAIPGSGVITVYGRNALCTPGTTVSAATYRIEEMAAGSIAATFGTGLAGSTVIAESTPLPTTLGGTTVTIIDRLGISRKAPLFFVSPNQINLAIPEGTPPGQAVMRIENQSGVVASGLLNIAKVAPGFFTADSSGAGLPAANIFRIRSNGEQVYEPVVKFDESTNKIVAVPVDLSNSADQVFLILYGTGIRKRMSLATVSATIGGTPVMVEYAQPQGTFVGLDQVAVRLPSQLAGSGNVAVNVLIDGKPSNTTNLVIK